METLRLSHAPVTDKDFRRRRFRSTCRHSTPIWSYGVTEQSPTEMCKAPHAPQPSPAKPVLSTTHGLAGTAGVVRHKQTAPCFICRWVKPSTSIPPETTKTTTTTTTTTTSTTTTTTKLLLYLFFYYCFYWYCYCYCYYYFYWYCYYYCYYYYYYQYGAKSHSQFLQKDLPQKARNELPRATHQPIAVQKHFQISCKNHGAQK